MKKIKGKINKPGTTNSEKIQLLTLIPDSWSQNAIIITFWLLITWLDQLKHWQFPKKFAANHQQEKEKF